MNDDDDEVVYGLQQLLPLPGNNKPHRRDRELRCQQRLCSKCPVIDRLTRRAFVINIHKSLPERVFFSVDPLHTSVCSMHTIQHAYDSMQAANDRTPPAYDRNMQPAYERMQPAYDRMHAAGCMQAAFYDRMQPACILSLIHI